MNMYSAKICPSRTMAKSVPAYAGGLPGVPDTQRTRAPSPRSSGGAIGWYLKSGCIALTTVATWLRKQGNGAIVNCSSLGGIVGLPHRSAYHASKHGVIGLTKSAAMDNTALGIRINAICPGCIDTPMGDEIDPEAMKSFLKEQPIGRMGRVDEIASTVLWLCSPGASFVLGVALPVDGGFVAH